MKIEFFALFNDRHFIIAGNTASSFKIFRTNAKYEIRTIWSEHCGAQKTVGDEVKVLNKL